VAGVSAAGGEHPVVAFGGELAGEVAVGGDDDAGWVSVVGGEAVGLGVGEGCAEGCDADVVGAGQGDGEDVDGSFDEDGGGAGGEPVGVFGDAVQLLALGEQDGVAGVEVLGAGLGGGVGAGLEVVGVGVAPTDEPGDDAVVVDGQDEPVAEGVDGLAGAGGLGQAGGEQLVVGGAVSA